MNWNAIFLRGTGGFSKSSRPYSYTKQPPIHNPAVKIPKEQPFAVHEECTQPSQGMDVNLYMPGHQVAYQSLPMADAAYPETTMAISPAASLMGQPSDTMTAARKRSSPGGVLERTVEKRHKRMIKNKESAACSTTRKQAYNNELGNKVSRLEEENERRRRKKLKPSSPVAVKQEKIAAK